MFATIFYDMFAAFGCMSATLILLILSGVMIAVRIGSAPKVAEFIQRVLYGPPEEVVPLTPVKEPSNGRTKPPADLN